MEVAGNLRRAGSWLAHPISIVALVVMILNDHYLKQHYGSWFTGKLSDAAGLIFFPALLAVPLALALPRLPWRSVAVISTLGTGVGFALVKATASGAAMASDLLTNMAGPSLVRVDTTDLLVLPFAALALAIGWRDPVAARWRVVAVLPIAVMASAATTAIPSAIPLQVTVIDGALAVGTGYSHRVADAMDMEWWTVEADGSLREVPYDQQQGVGLRARSDEPDAPYECFFLHPDVCYRPYEGHLGVERSDDGGESWVVDWQVPDDERELLLGAVQHDPEASADIADLRTFDIAIVPNGYGKYSVWAANGLDGLAKKDADTGEWSRVYGYYWDMEWAQPVPLPSEVPYVMAYPIPLPLVVFGVGLFIGLALITTAFRVFSNASGGALAVYIVGLSAGFAGSAFTLLVAGTGGRPMPHGMSVDFLLAMSCAMLLGIGGVVLSVALAQVARTRAVWALLATLGSAGVGTVVASRLPQTTFWTVWIGLGVAALLSGAAWWFFHRLPPLPPKPRWVPPPPGTIAMTGPAGPLPPPYSS